MFILSLASSNSLLVVCCSNSNAFLRFSLLSVADFVSSSATNLAFSISFLVAAFCTINSMSASLKSCCLCFNSTIAADSFFISSTIPENEPFSKSAPFLNSPLKKNDIASPTLLNLSIKTSTVAPIPAKALSNWSAPLLVLVKNVANEPKAITNKPIPVLAIPAFIVAKDAFAVFATPDKEDLTPFKDTPIILNSLANPAASLVVCPISD